MDKLLINKDKLLICPFFQMVATILGFTQTFIRWEFTESRRASCSNFPNCRKSSLLPPRFISNITITRFLQVIAIILALVYYDTKISQTTVMNVNGNLFQAVMNTNFMFQFTAVNASFPCSLSTWF